MKAQSINHSWTKICGNRMLINYTLPLLLQKVNDQKRMHMIKFDETTWEIKHSGDLDEQLFFLPLSWQHCQCIFRNGTPQLTSNWEEEYGLWGNSLISRMCYASIKRIIYWSLWCSNQELKKSRAQEMRI